MPKSPAAHSQMPPAAAAGLRQLGADLAVARLRRKESLASWAARVGTSVPTLMRMEAGEAGVGMGLYATALWLIGRSGALAALAAPEYDRSALELDVRAAQSLGKARAQASAASRLARDMTRHLARDVERDVAHTMAKTPTDPLRNAQNSSHGANP